MDFGISAVIAAGIAATAGGVSAGINAGMQASTNAINEKTFHERLQFDQQLAENQFNFSANQATLAYKRQQDMLANQREYDKPVNQLARLNEAGLNPLSFMGSGATGSGISASSTPMASTPSPSVANPYYRQAPQLNGFSEAVTDALNALTNSRNADTAKKRAEVQNELDYANIDSVKANTDFIRHNDQRADDLNASTIARNNAEIRKLGADTAMSKALLDNNKVRAQKEIVETQKQISEILSAGIEMDQKMIGLDIQKAGLDVTFQKVQAEVNRMNFDAICNYGLSTGTRVSGALAKAFGSNTRLGLSSDVGVSESSTSGNTANMQGGASFGTPSLAKGGLDLNFGGSYGASESETKSSNYGLGYSWLAEKSARQENRYEASKVYINATTLEPLAVYMKAMQYVQQGYTDVKLDRAIQNLQSYLKITSKSCVETWFQLQRQLEYLSPSIYNPNLSTPSGTDSYTGD